MAKVTARGDEPRIVWEGANGKRMVLTVKGRLLIRYPGTRRYAVLRTHCDRNEAGRLAGVHQMGRMSLS